MLELVSDARSASCLAASLFASLFLAAFDVGDHGAGDAAASVAGFEELAGGHHLVLSVKVVAPAASVADVAGFAGADELEVPGAPLVVAGGFVGDGTAGGPVVEDDDEGFGVALEGSGGVGELLVGLGFFAGEEGSGHAVCVAGASTGLQVSCVGAGGGVAQGLEDVFAGGVCVSAGAGGGEGEGEAVGGGGEVLEVGLAEWSHWSALGGVGGLRRLLHVHTLGPLWYHWQVRRRDTCIKAYLDARTKTAARRMACADDVSLSTWVRGLIVREIERRTLEGDR